MMETKDILNVHAIMNLSHTNGPGRRMVIWLQGCSLGCIGCFNPDTHSTTPKDLMTTDDLFEKIFINDMDIEGLTISGGEPLDQALPLYHLLRRLRIETSLSIIVFSGYTLQQIKKISSGPPLLTMMDVLIDGPYLDQLKTADDFRGSANQRIHLLTDRYGMKDFEDIPQAEIQIDPQGNLCISGFPDRLTSLL